MEALAHRLAHTPQQADGLVGKKGPGLGSSDNGEAARLVPVRGDLGEKLVVAEPDRGRDGKLLLHAARQRRQSRRRAATVQSLRAGEVHESLVDGERFHQRGQVPHHRPDLTAHRGILFHVRLDDRGVGADFQGLEHRHGRVHAPGTGDVAARGYDAPVVSADDHRKVPQLRAVAFLDGGVESVAVEMGNGEIVKFLVPHDACRSTGRAGSGFGGWLVAAVSAQGFHGMIIAPGMPYRKMSLHGPGR